MTKLIYRDLFIYQRRNLFLLPFFALWTLYISKMWDSDVAVVLCGIMMGLFGSILISWTAFGYDEMSKSDKILRAMPISPQNIVLSRFISCFVSSAMGLLWITIFATISNLFGFDFAKIDVNLPLILNTLLIWVITTVVFTSVILPFLFKFGYIKFKIPMMLFMIILMAGSSTWFSGFAENANLRAIFNNIGSTGLNAILVVLVILIFVISLKISTRFFATKEW